MKKIIFILAVLFSQTLFAQKVEVKDNVLSVDGKPYAHIERTGGLLSPEIYFEVKNLTTNKRLLVAYIENTDAINRNGDAYMKFTFLDSSGHQCELMSTFLKTEKFAKFIVKNNLLTASGELNEEEVKNFCLIKGTPVSDRNTIKVRL